MNISVHIMLGEDEILEETPTEVADGVLKAVKGDEDTDFVTVTIQHAHPPGFAGTPPPPPDAIPVAETFETVEKSK